MTEQKAAIERIEITGGRFDCAVVIPTHPGRGESHDRGTLLGRAVQSVLDQQLLPKWIVIAHDLGPYGAESTRQAGLDAAAQLGTEWVSFLDSDDTWYPQHLRAHRDLLDHGGPNYEGGDVAYSWFDGNDPFPAHRGRVYDPTEPHHLTMTLTVRTSLAVQAGFVLPDGPLHQEWSGEDWMFQLRLRDLRARFVGTGEVTWTYQVHEGNTSGLPTRGDAQR
jgi:hypothetical protein